MARMRRFELLIARGRIDSQGRRIIVFFLQQEEDHSATSAQQVFLGFLLLYVSRFRYWVVVQELLQIFLPLNR